MLLLFLLLLLLATKCSSIHRSMTDTELKHFFGTTNVENIPKYFLYNPDKITDLMDFEVNGVLETFQMKRKTHLFSDDFHIIKDGNSMENSFLTNCVYEGFSPNGTRLSIIGCDKDYHGMVITNDGEYHLIQPHKPSGSHIIHKRSLATTEHDCLFDADQDPYPEDRDESAMRSTLMRLVKDIRRAEHKKDILTIELAVFADDAMWGHFQRMYGKDAEENMHTFIMAVVNNIDVLYTQKLLQPRINIKIVRYEILKTVPQTMNARQHGDGDVDKLLDAFCQYQNEINPRDDADPRHWDHALLFSGYDLHRNGVKTVAGYAPVKGMCSGVRSCTINEGLDFGSVFVVTHEMGHSLGMYHDGDNECDLRCCIMSPSVGRGKTHWSHCSVNEMQTFVGHLGEDFRPPNCLQDTPIVDNKALPYESTEAPGQLFTLDEQCEIFHGECWKHELKDIQTMKDVCSMVWCGNGEGIIRTAHPALEGTFCGFGMVCHQGRCVKTNKFMRVTPGGWSHWNDRPNPTCGGRCSMCEIKGQISIRRSIRQCNNPAPNNGGTPCQGDEARGIVCQKEICDGQSVQSYASKVCTRIRDERSIPNIALSGEGMQFDQAICKVWCLISNSTNIRTVANFPDGTPCGLNQYCIKGECRFLRCSGTAVAWSEAECPNFVRPQAPMSSVDKTANKPSPYKEQKKEQFMNEWSGWSEWSECVTYDCRTQGLKVRVRRCLGGVCQGPLREKIACSRTCTADEIQATSSQQSYRERIISPLPNSNRTIVTAIKRFDNWSPWSICSVTCGVGQRIRRKINCPTTDAECSELSTCTMPACQQINFSWSPWSMCSVTCGVGQRIRRKINCQSNVESECSELASCTMPACPQTQPLSNSWTEWSEWSECSQSCGGGVQFRKRACFSSFCRGNDSDARRCNDQSCTLPTEPGLWTEWSAWSSCSTKCGTGHRSRRRRCYKGVCRENEEETERCYGNICST